MNLRSTTSVDLHMQQPPRGGIWVGITRDISKCNYPIIIILIVLFLIILCKYYRANGCMFQCVFKIFSI
ncbi:hypothetical protein V1477_016849 [Vespula maculifrons]|uniref:Uncharacterized protein n=1 Tax=Vespula maculifrons TaxID=7453 RepID=A0ABD2B4A7_VESMC